MLTLSLLAGMQRPCAVHPAGFQQQQLAAPQHTHTRLTALTAAAEACQCYWACC
jgi:hypothetical protein